MAHTKQLKQLRSADVRASFEHAVEFKGWALLQGAYFPLLGTALSDHRLQTSALKSVVLESAVLLQNVVEVGGSFQKKTAKISLPEGVQPAQVWFNLAVCIC